METNYFGPLRMVRAFAPVLAAGGGAVLNVLSVMAWMAYENSNSYSASKAAAWALTNGIRLELAAQGTHVTGLAMGRAEPRVRVVAAVRGRPARPPGGGRRADVCQTLTSSTSREDQGQ
ncbi:hypothetical protein GCM10022221_65800 [Actinocorallia aurea]